MNEQGRMSDAELLDLIFFNAQAKATPEEWQKIQFYRDMLENEPEHPEVIELCNNFRESIHHIITGQRQLELPFNQNTNVKDT